MGVAFARASGLVLAAGQPAWVPRSYVCQDREHESSPDHRPRRSPDCRLSLAQGDEPDPRSRPVRGRGREARPAAGWPAGFPWSRSWRPTGSRLGLATRLARRITRLRRPVRAHPRDRRLSVSPGRARVRPAPGVADVPRTSSGSRGKRSTLVVCPRSAIRRTSAPSHGSATSSGLTRSWRGRAVRTRSRGGCSGSRWARCSRCPSSSRSGWTRWRRAGRRPGRQFWAAVADPVAPSFESDRRPDRLALVLGDEDRGVEQAWLDRSGRKVTIPMRPGPAR